MNVRTLDWGLDPEARFVRLADIERMSAPSPNRILGNAPLMRLELEHQLALVDGTVV